MPWYKKLDIVADIFGQANFGKSFDKKKKHFFSLYTKIVQKYCNFKNPKSSSYNAGPIHSRLKYSTPSNKISQGQAKSSGRFYEASATRCRNSGT
jgi:hypothetical protein